MGINSLEDLRPGDIMISGMTTAPSKALVYAGQLLLGEHFRIGEFVAGHAGIVTFKNKLVESVASGARERDLRPSDWSPKHAYLRLPEHYPTQHIDAAAAAQTMINTPYSFASYVYLAAYIRGIRSKGLAERINRRKDGGGNEFILPSGLIATVDPPVEAICSVLVEQAWTMTGYKVVHGTRPQVVTPGMLAKQLWFRQGVIRGGAGIL